VTRKLAILLCLLLALACGREPEPAPTRQGLRLPPPPTEAEPDIDTDNLLNMAYGASAISRTAEANLEQSAVHAIDGIGSTAWWSPPGGGSQTLLFSLPALSRIHRIGLTTSSASPREIRFERSADGVVWHPVASLKPEPIVTTQMGDVEPFDSRFVRVSTVDPERYYVQLRSIHLIGTEIAPAAAPSPAGCWTINGQTASLRQEGSRVWGVIGGERPTFVEGAAGERVVRLMWSRGPMWGYALLTLAPDGKTLSALTFHEEIVTQYAGAAWFGKRTADDCTAEETDAAALDEILERSARWSMFGLRFDTGDRLDPAASKATLDALEALLRRSPSQRWRIVAHEYRDGSTEENRRRAAAHIEQLRSALASRAGDLSHIEFVAAGSEQSVAPVSTAIQRQLASRIDLERRH
jgi:outer membrane protein OmpA-like peptidoglycan-associated protein